MASSRSRQRKLARARYDRQVARRAATARRRRQAQAAVGAGLALLLIVFGSVWLFGGFDSDPPPAAAPDTCTWSPQNVQANDKLKDVGQPPTRDLPTTGTANMKITTNQGVVDVALDVASAPCTAASFTHLANQGFYGNTTCHQLLSGTNGVYALRCGDPSGTGTGGPAYTFADENVPAPPQPSPGASPGTQALYPKGTVAMASDVPGVNNSQFYIFYQDSTPQSGQYSIAGTVSAGLDVIEKIARAGAVDNGSGEKTKPKTEVKVESVAVTTGGADAPPSAPAGTATPSGTS